MNIKRILPGVFIAFSGCTYSITMAHTSGSASDLIDETSSQDVSPKVEVPLNSIPHP